ncbi:hypothetical protein ACFY9S_26990 [Streptomyces sp. NPDC012474]|uniref:hypothetical protein n=1 Tax=Streptomyces sp. NPDC012474 TaxID=3364836 RepID=UPI0036E31561
MAGPAATPDGPSSARSNGRPRFPSLGATNVGPAAPRRTEPAAPPPPHASTRFPDARPSAGRETRAASDRPSGVGGETGFGSDRPPRASTRVPEAQSGVGRETRAASDRPSGVGRETRPGSGRLSGPGGATGFGSDRPSGVGGATGFGSDRPSGVGGATGFGSDRPSGVGRETRPGSDRPSTSPAPGTPDTPPPPRHLPTPGFSGRAGRPDAPEGSSPETPGRPFRLAAPGGSGAPAGAPSDTLGRPFRLPPPRRTGAPGENTSETTARLRPVPADPAPDKPAGPFARPAASGVTAARPAAPPRPAHEPQGTAAARPATPPRPAHEPQAPSAPPHRGPAPVSPDPALSWSATRPMVSFGEPEGYDADARPRPLGRRGAPQAAAAAVCLVLGMGLISGALTGSWLVGGSGEEGTPSTFAAAGSLWHSVPVDQLFPPTVQGRGAGPGGADRTWTRIAVAPDSGCKNAFDPLLRKALAPVGCERLLRATYTDATESYVTTVGLLFTTADAPGMTALANRFRKERLDRRSDLMPLPYAAKGTLAAGFGAGQRASWTVSVLTEAPVVVYAVSGWADGRTVDDPQPAEDALEADATTAAAQAGLGNEAQGLADRVERDFRRNVRSASEQPS